ncbi:hypothetical protein LTR99_003452 [Exophiala xenobiotica]|uniref:Uncharacterized protein n=1 Tax=Vermiconidia calcicola TaxID=1690605 RepID=A0AAV9PVK4_9PEZI|nr:hypothetical protein LTR96_008240 [Exophiala xenobiotica]KAK5529176.1 hypothetical protein LTR25_009913 [Vermiconidia calcicola]KAK5547141.1 hypothetical protein LTR23_002780 [Chaetothyriales sp. CCFEE 6169]KAK5305907.1 hypothetical protein LTR99_003452 [Exophiala xenobiotica]KAK5335456.1 hypothetical protein LTR98_008456 [Exophiala xenobiotica]
MPQRTQEQRSTRLVAAPSVAEGSQYPPTSPPTPEFVTPVSSPQMSAFLGGDMTRLSLGSPGSGAILPTSTRQTTAAQEVEADDRLDMRSALLNRLIPYAQYYWFNSHKPGFTQPKRFMGVSCDICKRDTHPTDHHTSNPDQWLEVWRRKGNGKGKCNKKGCKSPTTHNTEDCGRGEFRDHPDNEPLPAELQYYSARRWPAATKEVPLPRYYYRPKDRQPPGPRDPYVPDEFAEHGLPCGLLDKAKGIYWSLDNAIAMAKGSIKPVTYVAKRHAQRGTIARNLGLPRSEQSENPSETDLDRGFRAW